MSYSIRQMLTFTTFVAGGMILYPAMIRMTSTAPTAAVLGDDDARSAWLTIHAGGAIMGATLYFMMSIGNHLRSKKRRK